MDIVLGVSMTPTTVRMVLVEGEKADGSIVDHDAFDDHCRRWLSNVSSAAEQVVEAVLGTKESAAAGGHHLKSIGVTWSDHAEASTLRDALAARGVDDVMLVSDGHAAGALAQAVGRAVGYATTALLFIDRDTATLSVVQTDDGSVVKVLSRTLHSDDAMAVLTEMAAAVDAQDSPPQGMFVVGSGVDVSSVKSHLENLVSAAGQRARRTGTRAGPRRGAGIGQRACLRGDDRRPGLLAGSRRDHGRHRLRGPRRRPRLSWLRSVAADDLVDDHAAQTDMEPIAAEEGRKPFLLVGSALTSIFVVGVVALVISLAVSIRPTVDQRPSPGPNAIVPEHRSACARAGAGGAAARRAASTCRRPSSRRCPSPCRRPPRLNRRRARCSSSRPPPRRRQRPPHHRLRHRLHPRRRRPHRFPWHQRRCPIFRRRCTTRRCTTRTCRRRFTTRGPGRGHLRIHRRGSSSRRSLKNRRSHRGTRSGRDPAAARVIPVTIREVTTRDPGLVDTQDRVDLAARRAVTTEARDHAS